MLYLGINYYESEIMKKNQQINSLNVELYHTSNELEQANSQIDALNQQVEQLYSVAVDEYELIEPIKYTDKKAYLTLYKEVTTYAPDPTETINDYTTDEEFELICRVIEAEAGICDFDGKVSVANVIINRYEQDVDNTWHDILFEHNQFSTISNGMYKKVEVSEDTKLALEFAFLFGCDKTRDCLYFKSGSDSWHDSCDKLEEVYNDKKHTFYVEKEEN